MNNSPIYDRIDKTLSDKKQTDLFRTAASDAGRCDIDLSTNSYLWLQANPDIAQAAQTLINGQLHGNCASRLVSVNSPLFMELEREIAAWKKTESALVFNSGYAANTGMIAALCTKETEVFSDRFNHASIIDGIALAKAKVSCYEHCDMSHLRNLLKGSGSREKFIVTDSVFSMDGDSAPLADICDLAKEFGCMLMVDEAHATGLFGKNGSGLVEALGLESCVDVRMGTLSKSVAGMGGYFAGTAGLRDYFVNVSRSLIFATALPHAVLAWDLAAVRHIRNHPDIGRSLLEKSDRFREALTKAGFDTLSSATQIVPCAVGGEKSALSLAKHLNTKGIKAPAIRPPTVPPGSSRVRFSVHAGVSEQELNRVVESAVSWKSVNA